MSKKIRKIQASNLECKAHVFAALGDETRLMLVTKLSRGNRRSISELTDGTRLTRQAITKHLRVLEDVGLVHNVKSGRESLFEFDSSPLEDLQEYLERVSQKWDVALARLKAFVED